MADQADAPSDPLRGLAAVVTGAGRGLGRSVALELAGRGVAVVAADNGSDVDGSGSDPAPAESVAEEIRSRGGSAVGVCADISDWQQTASVIDASSSEFGRLDIVVNCAGNFMVDTITTLSEDVLAGLLRVHVHGTLSTSHFAARHWKNRPGFGRLINVTSDAAMTPTRDTVSYAAAKGAVLAATRAAAIELAELGVTANCITQVSRTRMRSSYHGGNPEPVDDAESPDVPARLVSWLASPEAGHVTSRAFGSYGDRFVAWRLAEHEADRELRFEGHAQLADRQITAALSPLATQGAPGGEG